MSLLFRNSFLFLVFEFEFLFAHPYLEISPRIHPKLGSETSDPTPCTATPFGVNRHGQITDMKRTGFRPFFVRGGQKTHPVCFVLKTNRILSDLYPRRAENEQNPASFLSIPCPFSVGNKCCFEPRRIGLCPFSIGHGHKMD